MKTKRTKKEIEWHLNYHLHELQRWARRYQHKRNQDLKIDDLDSARYFEEQRDICRNAAEMLMDILRDKDHIPKNIIFLAKSWREETNK